MSDEELRTIWRESIGHYGMEMQSIVCMEECSELIQAVSKCLRGNPGATDNLTEEMADVVICLNLLKEMYGINGYEIHNLVQCKTFRQAKRMSDKNPIEDAK